MADVSLTVKMINLVVMMVSVVAIDFTQSNSVVSNSAVSVKWGVPDSTATVGKVFRLHIPSDAFDGEITSITVETTDGWSLPKWLEFNEKDRVLQGIPAPSDAGQVFLEITAHGKNSQASVSCTIYIRDVASHTSGAPLRFKSSGPEFVSCKDTDPETIATIILDVDLESLPVSTRLELMNKFMSHMQLHEAMLKMMPVGNIPFYDSSALVSGTGDCLSPKTSGLFISWPVGCGQVKDGHFPVLQKLDNDSGSGHMAKLLDFPVIGWQVTNSRFQAPTRKRRQVQVKATPALSPTMSTKIDSVDDDVMTRKVIDGQSPTFQPTATQPHMPHTDKPLIPTETAHFVVPMITTKAMPEIIPSTTHDPIQTTGTHVDGIPDTCTPGEKPQVKTPISDLRFRVGDIIDYIIPEDAFEDCEVGGTRGLELNLYKDIDEIIKPDFFLQFDVARQRIIGLPMREDAGQYTLNLIGRKKSNPSLTNTVIQVFIEAAENKTINHKISVAIDYDYDKFKASVQDKVNLANRVASVYGDPDASKLEITTIERGSVIYGWTNSSVKTVGCPSGEINDLVRKLVNEDGSLSDNAIEKMKPFVLLSAQAQPAGDCEGDSQFPVVVSKPRDPSTIDKGEVVPKGAAAEDDSGDFWIKTVVPIVVIIVIVIIALVIACVLYRKKRKGKMNVEEQNTFVNKGAPVIFPYELEEKPSDVNRPLLVEGSPSAPPDYHRGSSESPEPQLSGNYKNISASNQADDSITEFPEKPYEPPPPVTTSTNGKQPRPPHQQQPFSQTPQILP